MFYEGNFKNCYQCTWLQVEVETGDDVVFKKPILTGTQFCTWEKHMTQISGSVMTFTAFI